jgi:ribosomal protein S7
MIKKKNFYYSFVSFLVKKGNKNKIITIINKAFLKSSLLLNLPLYYIIAQLFLKLNTYVEIKKVKFRHNFNFIPFPISYRRRVYLISKWFVLAIKENKNSISLSEKIVAEILLIFNSASSSYALKLKKENESKAILNRSNIHFRW